MKYIEKIRHLASKHKLSFTFNPGGGEFNDINLGRCQISTYDDKKDYEKLLNWLKINGLEK